MKIVQMFLVVLGGSTVVLAVPDTVSTATSMATTTSNPVASTFSTSTVVGSAISSASTALVSAAASMATTSPTSVASTFSTSMVVGTAISSASTTVASGTSYPSSTGSPLSPIGTSPDSPDSVTYRPYCGNYYGVSGCSVRGYSYSCDYTGFLYWEGPRGLYPECYGILSGGDCYCVSNALNGCKRDASDPLDERKNPGC